ncbi:MAG: CsbD family protein [Thermoanaerobaculia bacterium]
MDSNPAGRTDREESIWSEVEGNWNQFKGAVKEKWGKLTDDDLTYMEGRRDRVIGKLQERYSDTKMEEAAIERDLQSLRNRR